MKTALPVKIIHGNYCYKARGYWNEFGNHFHNMWTKVLGVDAKLDKSIPTETGLRKQAGCLK